MNALTRLVCAAASVAVFACGGAAHAQVVNWQHHSINPAGFWLTANQIAFAKKAEAATGGRLKLNVFPAGASGFKDREALDAISENLLQIGEAWGGHVAGQEQIMELMDLPLFVPGDTAFRFKLWDALRPQYAELLQRKYKVVVYDVGQLNPRRLYTKTPVTTLAGLRGLKIRAIGPADAAWVRALGAEATTTNWGELYTALQQKVVDGHMAAYGAHLAMKFNEVTEYIYETANAGPTYFILVNEAALAKLPADARERFLGLRQELTNANRESYTTLDPKARETLLQRGMKFNPVAPADEAKMREAAKPIVEQWAAKLRPDARKIYDTARTMIDAHYAAAK